jgi:glucose-1-phosphate thymidylyltransferase
MRVQKAVVLAGRCGGERWPSFGLPARQLVPVANKPVLFHHLEALAGAGVREVSVIADGTTAASLRAAVGDGARFGLAVSRVIEDGIGSALTSSEVLIFAAGVPLLVSHGDVLLRERLSPICEEFLASGLDCLLLEAAVTDVGSPTPGAVVGWVLGPDALDAFSRSETARQPVPTFSARAIEAAGLRVATRKVLASLPCRGPVDALLDANRLLLEDLGPGFAAARVIDSKIQGRVDLPASAIVRASIIRGPVTVGGGARICNAYIGPYTAVGADTQLEGVEIENSIVFDGACVGYVGTRIEASVIGPHAHVGRDFAVPSAIRLSVGEGAQVALT